ncbi:MAG: phosphatase PAP2 family protein [Fimbriimonas sp.]
MQGLNDQVFRSINGWPEGLAPTMRFFSEATNFLWVKIALLLMLVGMIALGKKSRRAAVQALIAFPLANELTDVFKAQIPRHRPFQEIADMIHRSGWADSMGTASAHSANMAAVAYVFTYHLGWRWGAPWIVTALLTGLSRIYNGDHYPYQVLLGWSCGAGVAFVVTWTWDFIRTQRKPVRESDVDRLEDSEAPV